MRCSKFSQGNWHLTECPSSETFKLLECYDAWGANDEMMGIHFWCWSRRDNDEKVIKNVSISTTRVEEDDGLIAKINQPFSTQFTFNGTHLKCDTMETWATEYIDVSTTDYATLLCVTSTISVAEFYYCNLLITPNCDLNGL